jgi:hypothetical protein
MLNIFIAWHLETIDARYRGVEAKYILEKEYRMYLERSIVR